MPAHMQRRGRREGGQSTLNRAQVILALIELGSYYAMVVAVGHACIRKEGYHHEKRASEATSRGRGRNRMKAEVECP